MGPNPDIRPVAPDETLALRHKLLRPHLTPVTCVYPGDDAVTTIHLCAFLGHEQDRKSVV